MALPSQHNRLPHTRDWLTTTWHTRKPVKVRKHSSTGSRAMPNTKIDAFAAAFSNGFRFFVNLSTSRWNSRKFISRFWRYDASADYLRDVLSCDSIKIFPIFFCHFIVCIASTSRFECFVGGFDELIIVLLGWWFFESTFEWELVALISVSLPLEIPVQMPLANIDC